MTTLWLLSFFLLGTAAGSARLVLFIRYHDRERR